MKISLLDTPGQSLPLLLQDEEKQITSFENTGAIIYIFDYPTWITDSQAIIDDIQTLYKINKKLGFGSKIVLFLHKVDLLIDKKIGSRLDLIGKQINTQLDLPDNFPIYFTSLHPNLIYTIYNAISDTFSNFSEDSAKLKDLSQEIIKDSSKTICFVSNKDDNLILQASSPDFDTTTLYYLYEKIYHSSKTTEQSLFNSKFINAGSKLLYVVVEDIGKFHSNFKNLLLFSETMKENELNILIDEIEKRLEQLYT